MAAMRVVAVVVALTVAAAPLPPHPQRDPQIENEKEKLKNRVHALVCAKPKRARPPNRPTARPPARCARKQFEYFIGTAAWYGSVCVCVR